MQHTDVARGLAADMRANCLGVRVGRMHRLVARTFEQVLRPLGLTLPQLEVLSALTIIERPIRPAELADILAVERSTMSRNLGLLQTRGWIAPSTTSPTGRSMAVVITDAGLRRLAEARETWETAQRDLIGSLGADAPAQLDTWIGQLVAHDA